MAFAFLENTMGMVGPADVDLTGPGPGPIPTASGGTFGRMNQYNEELRAYDLNLGAITLVYLKFSGVVAAGSVCEITPVMIGTTLQHQATPWAGTSNSGRPLCVALIGGVAGQFGWFTTQGNALVNSSGAPVAGNPVYWQAAGVVSPTPVAGKHLLGGVFSTAPSVTLGSGSSALVLTATQAVININRPYAQGSTT